MVRLLKLIAGDGGEPQGPQAKKTDAQPCETAIIGRSRKNPRRTNAMPTRSMNPLNRLVRHVRRAALMRAPCVLSDGRLLESFLARRDEASLEMLVKRHGPMVL